MRTTEDITEWSAYFETDDRHVGKDMVGDKLVSTVFLGLDHGFGSKPALFETMVFGADGLEEDCQRYETFEQAKKGHSRWVRKTMSGCSAVYPKPRRQLEL